MSEIVGKRIQDLESIASRFGKMVKTEKEVSEFKEWIKETLEGDIYSNLTALVKELQEHVPVVMSRKDRTRLLFNGYCLNSLLTREGVLDMRQSPPKLRPFERLVDAYIHPNLTFYPKEHNPSIQGAKSLIDFILL